MESIYTESAPRPAGHYSQAITHQGIVYVSGQLPVNPATSEKTFGSIEEQTRQALENLEAILKASGSDSQHVLRTTVYVSDIELWPRVNKEYADFFKGHQPARTVVPTRDLHYGFLIELDAIAAQIIHE